jgi:hypothetical protein
VVKRLYVPRFYAKGTLHHHHPYNLHDGRYNVEQNQFCGPAQAHTHRHSRQVTGNPFKRPESKTCSRTACPACRRATKWWPESVSHCRSCKGKESRECLQEKSQKIQEAWGREGNCRSFSWSPARGDLWLIYRKSFSCRRSSEFRSCSVPRYPKQTGLRLKKKKKSTFYDLITASIM